MKKTKWFGAAFMLAALALTASACTGGGNAAGGGTGGSVPKDDVYEDYKPDKQPGGDAFDYDGNYAPPELTIDGKGDDPQWQAIKEPLTTFGKKIDGKDAVSVKVYRGKDALFFLFDVTDPVLLTKGNTNDDAVTRGDSIELYLDTLGDGGRSPQSDDYQINLGIHGKTRIMQGAGGLWGSWNGLIDYEVDLKGGTLNDGAEANDTGYSVEVMVPYKQIMIEKDDTIAIAFGQVDKVGLGDITQTDWNWYGWDWGGTFREPQTPDNYALLDKDNNLIDRDDQEKAPADLAGFVRDTEGAPVEGATASVEVGGETKTATTAADGYFVIEDVDPEGTYTVTVSKTGYLDGVQIYTRAELRAANGGRVLKDFTVTATADLETTTVTGTVKNIVNGTVGGAEITVKGTAFKTTADQNGAFSIEGVPAGVGDITLVVTHTGYGDSETLVKESDLVANGTTALGDVNLNLPYADLGEFATGAGKVGANQQLFANIHTQLSRALTGVEIHFDGTRILHGKIELYLDTKESTGVREQDPTAWRLDLNADGTIGGSHYAGGAFTAAGLVYNVSSNTSEGGYHATLLIPYSYLDIAPLEVFGLSLGQWSTMANGGNGDWDGWAPSPHGFVAPENTPNYLRIGSRNTLYKANNNTMMATLSGNVGIAGVTVSAKGVNATSGADGAWNMSVPVDANAVEVTYTKTGYVTKKSTIAAGHFSNADSWTENVTLQEHKVTISGTVTDQDGNAVAGVEITIEGEGVSFTATTDASGRYSIDNVTTFVDLTVSFEKEDYAAGSTSFTAAQLAAGNALTADKQITSLNAVKKITVTGKVTGIEGNLQGVTVRVDGSELSATTNADGTFSLADFDAVDSTLTLSKAGFVSATVRFNADDVGKDETSYSFTKEIYLALDYVNMGGSLSTWTNAVTRGENGFEFRFVNSAEFTGTLEVFVDTKESHDLIYRDAETQKDSRTASDYRFDLNSDGTLAIINFGGGTNTVRPNEMLYSIETADSGTTVKFVVPYKFLNVAREEIIGVSLGYNPGSGWLGWNHETLKGANGAAFVKPEMTADYLRVGKDNVLFENNVNYTTDTLDLRDYNIAFGVAHDMFFAKVDRDETGVTFSFASLGDFNKNGAENEMILIYFDFLTNSPGAGGAWSCVDYLIKIASDGKVYGSNGEGKSNGAGWWSATEADRNGWDEATINRNNGITTISYHISLERMKQIGLGADNEIFGVVMREASHNADNHALYGEWYDCNFEGTGRDGNGVRDYIRVAPDGRVYTAGDNNPVTE